MSYMLLQNLVSPAKVEKAITAFEVCLTAMGCHFKPATNGFAEHFKFYNAYKSPTETVNEWAVKVRSLAVYCELGANLETVISDKFVMGLEKFPARDNIFLESIHSTFDKVVKSANNVEYTKCQYENTDVKEESLNFIKRKEGWEKKQQQLHKATQQHQP